jgi:hypothetical protein
MDSHTRRSKALWFLLGLPAALLLVVFAVDSISGGGHPSLSALLLFWGLYPTLTLFLSRALLGSEFLSPLLMLLGFLEYPLVGVGLASSIAKSQRRVGARTAVVVLLIYISAQFIAHLLLSLQSVNLRLMADANPAVSIAAVDRIRESGDAAAVPALQQKLVEDFERQGNIEAGMLDTLTVLGGARGWQDLLGSGRLGVMGPLLAPGASSSRTCGRWPIRCLQRRVVGSKTLTSVLGTLRDCLTHSRLNWSNGCRLLPTVRRRLRSSR